MQSFKISQMCRTENDDSGTCGVYEQCTKRKCWCFVLKLAVCLFDMSLQRKKGVMSYPILVPNEWSILPSQGRGSGPGSNRDIIRFDFFLLSAWEYSMPYHSGLRKSKLHLGLFIIYCYTLQVSWYINARHFLNNLNKLIKALLHLTPAEPVPPCPLL